MRNILLHAVFWPFYDRLFSFLAILGWEFSLGPSITGHKMSLLPFYHSVIYNAANGISPFVSAIPRKGRSSFMRFASTSPSTSPSISSTTTTDLAFTNMIGSLAAVQKNLASAKRQLKVLSIYSAEEIKADSALRLKSAQLELTLKHIFDESSLSFDKTDLEAILGMLNKIK